MEPCKALTGNKPPCGLRTTLPPQFLSRFNSGVNAEQLEELMSPVTNACAGHENPTTDDMIANVSVLVVDSSDTNTDSIIPENLENAEYILVDVASSAASINDPATDDMIMSGMPQDVKKEVVPIRTLILPLMIQ